MKLKLIFVSVLALGCMAHAQGIMSNLSIGAGLQGIFASSTFTKSLVLNGTLPNTQSSTNSVGAVADARYEFGRHSAVGFAVTVNRDTEVFFNGESNATVHAQTNNAEMIGSYIFRLPSNEHVKPFALFGGGMTRFSPNNAFNTSGTPQTTTKPTFAYGFGTDLTLSSRWAIRLQYRGLLRTAPDFKLSSSSAQDTFGTQLRSHVAEPSIQLVYHF